MLNSNLPDVFTLLGRIPLCGFRFLATHRTKHPNIAGLVRPILKQNFETRLAGNRRTLAVEVPLVVQWHLDGNGNATLTLIHFSEFTKNVLEQQSPP
jgi:hypothetical protein